MTSKVDYTCLGPRIPSLVYFAQISLHVIMGKRGNPGMDTLSNTWGVTAGQNKIVFANYKGELALMGQTKNLRRLSMFQECSRSSLFGVVSL
jgi:hypothetical protein